MKAVLLPFLLLVITRPALAVDVVTLSYSGVIDEIEAGGMPTDVEVGDPVEGFFSYDADSQGSASVGAFLFEGATVSASFELSETGHRFAGEGDELDYIDHACLDLLANWEKQHELTGGKLYVDWEGLQARFRDRNGRRTAAPDAQAA